MLRSSKRDAKVRENLEKEVQHRKLLFKNYNNFSSFKAMGYPAQWQESSTIIIATRP